MIVNKSFILKTKQTKNSSYLAGLYEGVGCIWIPINERDKMNKIIYLLTIDHWPLTTDHWPFITLTFNSKDFPLISIKTREIRDRSYL